MDVEAQALEMGWKPQDQFKGPAEKWVDAETYVRRGEEVLPLVRNENRKLLGKVDALNSTIAQLQQSLVERDTAMTEFREFQTEFLQQRLKEQRAQILGQIREAREAGDDTRLAELEDQLDENRAAQRGAKAPAPAPAPAANKPPPSLFGSIPSGVHKWKFTAPDITAKPIAAPNAFKRVKRGRRPTSSNVEAASSAEPMTYWLKRPVWPKRPGNPSDPAQPSRRPKISCVFG